MSKPYYTDDEIRRHGDFNLILRTTPDYLLGVIRDFNRYYTFRLPLPAIQVYLESPDSSLDFRVVCQFDDKGKRWTEDLGWIELVQASEETTAIRWRDAESYPWTQEYFDALGADLQAKYNRVEAARVSPLKVVQNITFQSGGVNISTAGDANIAGDAVGQDKTTQIE